MHRTESDPHP